MNAFFGRSEPGLAAHVDALTALHYRIGSVLLDHDGQWQTAAADLEPDWNTAEPEYRAALLLGFAWSSRTSILTEDESPAGLYAAELHGYSREFSGTVNDFHGEQYPLLPYPGPAGALAASIAFDRDDTDISLQTALLLASADGPNVFQGGDPAPGCLHIPTGPHPTDPHAPITLSFPLPDDAFPPD
ncbi:hypothetical protein [Nocardia altamirensis]|uniref:hypothetical protein n=1 Tax=Nocardia altamirensis TaxID=472158 RepID=UPI00083FDC90|nr:hypothetical protein [Nocardia altamirensis]